MVKTHPEPEVENGRSQLRAWIDRMKITQAKAAELLRVHPVYLCRLLGDDRRLPGIEIAMRIQDVTGISARSWRRSPLYRKLRTMPHEAD